MYVIEEAHPIDVCLCISDTGGDNVCLTEWETQKEVGEFLRAAQLYRPLSSVMASRFTRAQYDDDTDKAKVEHEKVPSSP